MASGVLAQSGPGGGYLVDPAGTLPPITLTAEQVVGLHAAVEVAGDIPFQRDVEAALSDVLPAKSGVPQRSHDRWSGSTAHTAGGWYLLTWCRLPGSAALVRP